MPPLLHHCRATRPRRRITLAAVAGLLALAGLPTSAPAAPVEDPATGLPGGRPRICLVLSGGGARGAAHIGVLKVLDEMRIPVDCIVGTSLGAIIGGAYAAGVNPQHLEDEVRRAQWGRVLSDEPARPDRSTRSRELERQQILGPELGLSHSELILPRGAIIGQELELFLQEFVGQVVEVPDFDRLPIPFRAIATDIETGSMVVLDHGSLAAALRASMSVPGVFAPQELDGRLLADGGLVRNLGVDIARSMGAEVIIAVNLGTPLLKRDALNSLLGVSQQTINILTEQNVQRSLRELGPQDVLILPELGDFGAGDFEHSADVIATGEAAARKVHDRLATLSLSPAEYARYLTARPPQDGRSTFDRVRVDTGSLKRVNPAEVEALYRDVAGASSGREAILAGVTALYATDDFQQIRLRVNESPGSRELVIQPTEKRWGPNYLRFGLGLSTDFAGNSDFTLMVDDRMTWLTNSGLEWRNTAALGRYTRFATELYQPLDVRRRFFLAPRLEWSQRIDDVYLNAESIARYRDKRASAALDLGFRFGTAGEFRAGVDYTMERANRTTGAPLFENFRSDGLGWHARLTVDQLDDWLFPQSGYYLNLDARIHRAGVENERYDQMVTEGRVAFGGGRHSITLGLTNATTFGTPVPFFDAFAIGGPVVLPGYRDRELLLDGYTLAQITYQFQLYRLPFIRRGFVAGVTLQAADLRNRLNGNDPRGIVYGTSAFLSTGTPLGPVYLGVGLNDAGEHLFYLYLARP